MERRSDYKQGQAETEANGLTQEQLEAEQANLALDEVAYGPSEEEAFQEKAGYSPPFFRN
ncbi:hypothetical protein FHS18_003099 [Paenibacillus phyllosphaerae]|uniref:Uncharacterized protein n=1 Tax=Paenibacillus phyllosphaerae TaxID=274593 RepID=A0A7W5AZC2_9BACL|nr:hypothetical protein [Paenibacillus phyllosphaerae]MBB3111031.1 hypothetical protein [Paenibacillus phyllosphaerae]